MMKYDLNREKLKKYIIENAEYLARANSVSLDVEEIVYADGTKEYVPHLSVRIDIDDTSILDETH